MMDPGGRIRGSFYGTKPFAIDNSKICVRLRESSSRILRPDSRFHLIVTHRRPMMTFDDTSA